MYTRFQQTRTDTAFPLPVLSLSLGLSKDSYLLWTLSQQTSQEAPRLPGLTYGADTQLSSSLPYQHGPSSILLCELEKGNQSVLEIQFANSNLRFGFNRDKRVVRAPVGTRNKWLGALPNNFQEAIDGEQLWRGAGISSAW